MKADTGAKNRLLALSTFCTRKVLYAISLVVLLTMLEFNPLVVSSHAGPNWEGQARSQVRSILNRAAFKHIIGSAIDLPLTLPDCIGPQGRAEAYRNLRDIFAIAEQGRGVDPKFRKLLCHPHNAAFETDGSSGGRLLFTIPAQYCHQVRATVISVLNDATDKTYRDLLDHKKQDYVRQLFESGRHSFPTTSVSGYSPRFTFTAG